MILCYYHEDMDGICSAAIINKVYGDVRCIPVQYNRNTWDIQDVVDSEEVFVVDFTFPDMEKLAEIAGDKLHWIDHHKTAYEQHKILWDAPEVRGYRDLDNSGCGLTWKYCHNEELPNSVKYIEDRDLWKFKFENTKAFGMGISHIIEDPYDPLWDSLLEGEYTEEIKIIELGEILLDSQTKRIKKLFEGGKDVIFNGYKTRLVNAMSDVSELGEYVYSNGYDLALIWFVIGDKIIFSMRSNMIDCAEIAQKYGGGGHTGAAGFSIVNVNFPLEILNKE